MYRIKIEPSCKGLSAELYIQGQYSETIRMVLKYGSICIGLRSNHNEKGSVRICMYECLLIP